MTKVTDQKGPLCDLSRITRTGLVLEWDPQQRKKIERGEPIMKRASRKKLPPSPRAAELSRTALELDLPAEIESLRGIAALESSGRTAKTLVKHPDFRVILTVMKAGACVREHKAAGRISIQTLNGNLRLRLPTETVDLPAGRLLALDRGVAHDVEAVSDSAFLVTIAWPRTAA